jgi:hypothetical protein
MRAGREEVRVVQVDADRRVVDLVDTARCSDSAYREAEPHPDQTP